MSSLNLRCFPSFFGSTSFSELMTHAFGTVFCFEVDLLRAFLFFAFSFLLLLRAFRGASSFSEALRSTLCSWLSILLLNLRLPLSSSSPSPPPIACSSLEIASGSSSFCAGPFASLPLCCVCSVGWLLSRWIFAFSWISRIFAFLISCARVVSSFWRWISSSAFSRAASSAPRTSAGSLRPVLLSC